MKKVLLGMGVFALATAALEAQYNPCVASTTTYCSPPPSLTLASVSPNPITTSVCGTVSASTTMITNAGKVYRQSIDESCYITTTLLANIYPTYVSNWTVVYWGSQRTTNSGLSASFTPTSAGSGTITFYVKYTTPTPCAFTSTSIRSVSVTVTNCAPVITSQPTNQTVAVGDAATFNVVACGTVPLSYQWRFNGTDLPGATASSYTRNNVQLADSGNYSVRVTNVLGAVTGTAILTVTHCDPYTSGLVSWWQGENNTEDVFGLNRGWAEGFLTYDAGKVGQAFVFDGYSTDIRVPLSASSNVGQQGAFTIEAWINPGAIASAQPLFAWRRGCSIWLSASAQGSLDATIKSIDPATGNPLITQTISSTGTPMQAGQFQHIAMTCGPVDGSGHMPVNLFVNGSSILQASIINWQGIPATAGDFYFGFNPDGPSSGTRFAGLIDEASLYNRALSSAEVQTLYRVGAYGKCPIAPSFLSQTVPPVTVMAGNDVVLRIPVKGTSLSYQWYFDDGLGGGPQPVGGNQSTLPLSNVQTYNAGSYTLQVTSGSGLGSITSPPLILTVLTPACISAQSGLISWWEGENNADDVFGLNPGILEGYPSFWSGKVGNAFYFPGSEAYILVPASGSLNVAGSASVPLDSFTLEAWINPQDVSTPQPLFAWGGGVALWLGLSNVGSLDANVRMPLFGNSIDNVISAPMARISANRFYHVAITFDLYGSGFKRLFVNGVKVQEALAQPSGTGHYGGPPLTVGDFYFAYSPLGFANGDPLGGAYFGGLIDEVGIYNRALSESEILAIYNAAGVGRCEIAPVFFSQPSSQTVTAGNDATFQVSVKGTVLTYQWFFDDGHGGGTSPIFGANQATLYLPNVQSANAGTYTVQVTTDQAATISSSPAVLTVVPAVAVAAPNGVAAWWRGEGDTQDIVGNNPATVDGWMNYDPGKVGQAFSLGGGNDLRIPAPANWNGASWSGFTIEAWIKPNLNPPGIGTPQPFMEQFNLVTGERLTVSLSARGPGSLDVTYLDPSGNAMFLSSAPGSLRDGVFQQIAVTYTDDDWLNLYVNGKLVATEWAYVQIPTPLGLSDLYFGFSPSGSLVQQYFTGQMDEITIYNRFLDGSEIQAIYNAGSAGKIPPCKPAPGGLVSWWQAEGNGIDVFNLNSAIPGGGVTFTPGETGQAFTFSGSANVRVPASVSLNVGTGDGFTIEAWVNPSAVSTAQPLLEWNSGFLTGVAIWLSDSGYLCANLRDTALDDNPIIAGYKLNAGVFQHVALNYDKTDDSVHLFLNGMEVGQQTSLVPVPPLTRGDLYFGFSPKDDEGQFVPQLKTGTQFAGQIDEVGLYDHALSASEIRTLYTSGKGGKCGIGPVITIQPASQTANVGNNVAFHVVATGTSLTFQWFVDHGQGPQAISGVTASTLTLMNVQLTAAASYSVQVANDVGSVMSSAAVLTVNPVGNGTPPPVIAAQPQSQAACEGDSPVFTVSATGSGTLRYQWCKDTININGATSSTYTVATVSIADSGTYSVIVYDSVGHVASAGATLTVHSRPSAWLLGDTTINPGAGAPIFALLDGTGPWNLAWSDGTTENGVTDNPHVYWVAPDSTKTYKLLALSDAHCFALPGELGGNVTVTVQGASLEPPKRALGQYPSGSLTDFTFGGDMWFYIDSQVDLYGTTTIEGGTTILFSDSPNAKIVIHDPTIICDTGPYRTATFMSADLLNYAYYFSDPSTPTPSGFYGQGLSLDFQTASSVVLKNLQFFNLGSGISFEGSGSYSCTLYDCQFIDCSNALAQTAQDAAVNVFNALFCDNSNVFALDPAVSAPQVNLQHITVDVCRSFVAGSAASGAWNGKNSLLVNVQDQSTIPLSLRNSPTCRTLSGNSGIFQTGGDASHYLANNTYRGQGTLDIDPTLLTDLPHKTTYPPLDLPLYLPMGGSMTFSPQVRRYASGSNPDLGYCYDALDYTISDIVVLEGGQVNVLPGTAIGLRYDWFAAFNLHPGSSFTSLGTPARPNTFAPVSAVQEGPFPYILFPGFLVSFMPDYWPQVLADSRDPDFNPDGAPPPDLNFRFSNFYLTAGSLSHHFWSGMVISFFYSPFFLPETSVSSAMSLKMQDCSLHSGWINLGEPDGDVVPMVAQPWWPPDWLPFGGPPIPGNVSLFNNLFDRVNINLDADTGPTWWGGPYTAPTIDLRLTATNNTFRGGWLYLEPINASAGNWVFENNLFDKTVFAQDQYQPLDYDYNAYWPCVGTWPDPGTELLVGQLAHLLPTTAGDGYVDGIYDGAHELKLTAAPLYQSGPLGDFYLPTTTPLFGAGSHLPGEVGLYHYTTRTDQVKEGAEPAGHKVNIGLHYVAVDNSGKPKDLDSPSPDGIPDYVEDANGNGVADANETDWRNPMTDGQTADAYSTVYDDIDLDGDGLAGGAEKALGTNPLVPDNPLDLPVVAPPVPLTGLVRVALSVSAEVDSDTPFMLRVNGVTANTVVYKTGAGWFAEWDTLQVPNGTYRLNLEFQDSDSTTAVGPMRVVTVQNPICFPDGLPLAGDTLRVEPQTIHANGTWTMQIYDDQGDLFASLNGQVDSEGFCLDPGTNERGISLSLLDGQGNQLPSDYYTVTVSTASGCAGPASATTVVAVEKPWTGNRKWVIASQRFYNFGTEVNQAVKGTMDLAAERVQETYGFPVLYDADPTAPPSTWRLTSTDTWGTLAFRLGFTNPQTEARNFLFFGHFDGKHLGGTDDPARSISVTDLRNWLGNAKDPLKGPNKHPFRFVFIDGCNSANGDLCTAFGIPASQLSSKQMTDKGLEPRAFVGWKHYQLVGLGGYFNYSHQAYVEKFWELWPMTNPATGKPYTLQEAWDDAYKKIKPIMDSKPVIYGCPDLLFR